MGAIEGLLLLTGGVYLGALVWLNLGLRRAGPAPLLDLPSVSVVVAARNEEASIGACLGALRSQEYPGEWEVVVVDDRSSDGTAQLVAASGWPGLQLVAAPSQPQYRCPKKSALAAGISHSRGELLLFTDADCQPPADWISNTVRLFGPGVGLVIGHAFPRPIRGLGQRLLALDNLAIGALGAGSAGWGRALSCTGRNLAYRRQVYEEVGGFSRIGHLVGGDDVYFMRLVGGTAWAVVPNPIQVDCDPPPASWRGVLHQKLRHAAKAGHYRGPALLLGAGVYLFHLLLSLGVLHLLLGGGSALFLVVWLAKGLADLALLARYARRPAERGLLWLLPILELVYIPYVLCFTLAGRLGWFRWK